MREQFYNILTNVGKAQIANSNVLGNKINFVKFKVGDGGGKYYNPTPEQQDLVNTVWEGAINSIFIDENNSNWIVVQTIIPSNVGGFTIREAAIFDDDNNMIAVGKYPETYKPIFAEGSAKDLIIKIIFEVSNAENITLKVDPTVILATKSDIKTLETKMLGLLEKHSLSMNHIYYCGKSEGESNIYQVNPGSAPDLQEGLAISLKAHRDSTAECKCIYKNSSQISILKPNGKPIKNFKKGGIYTMRYDGENFILQGEGGSGNSTAADILAGKTASTDAGDIVGTMKNNGTKAFTPGRSNIALGGFYADGSYIKGDSQLISNNIMRDKTIFDVTGNCDLSDYAKNQLNNAITNAGGMIGSDLSSILNGIGGLATLGSNVIQIPEFSFTEIEKEDTKITKSETIGSFTIQVTKWWHKYSTKSYYASYTFPVDVDVKAKISVNSRQNYVGAENMTIRTKRMDIVIEWHSSNTTIDDSRRNTNSINSINFAYYDYDRNLNEMDNRDVIVFY